ncbi:dihydrofolate reductase-like domain-containing protein [Apiosordaria backusii]|uniref:2,5-diamino-6-ribosylamino-4(3H)-pyrimidinone 5'-phosphate reductase n=1 Tax=Apiosordaria backusii TaxID=314023 RepID=A0AA40EG91_9PEZI|nr:dihydrofolate reductase-like domain-containing protein [Apiosordaria backusii]
MPRQVRYNLACSLDGFIAAPDGSYSWIVDDKTIDFEALYNEFEYFLMGRTTWETYLAMGPTEDPLGRYYRTGRVVVVSDTLSQSSDDVRVVKVGELEGVVRGLRATQGAEEGKDKDIWLMGGGKLAGLMMELGLVDVVEAAVMPVILGEGVKMVDVVGEGRENGWRLELQGVEKKETGILMTRYKVVRLEEK